jgi:hypothetical protein
MHWVSSLQCGVIDRFITQCVSSVELLDLKSSRASLDYRLICAFIAYHRLCLPLVATLARCISESSYVTYNFKCVKAFHRTPPHKSSVCLKRVDLTKTLKYNY